MRAALISLAAQVPDGSAGGAMTIAGKTVAQRQLEFSLAVGCQQIIAVGDGATSPAIALARNAARLGAQFHAVNGSHGLLGLLRSDDDLLVIAPNILPESEQALAALSAPGAAILVVPAAGAVQAGFERIDRERAWAGALVIPGALVDKLAELPADADVAPALLRIALQAHVREFPIEPAVLSAEGWQPLSPGEAAAAERAWFERSLPRASPWTPSSTFGLAIINAIRVPAMREPRSTAFAVAVFSVLLGGAGFAAWLGFPATSLLLLAVAVVAKAAATILEKLKAAPFGRVANSRRLRIGDGVVDLALAACSALAIGGGGLHALFPPLVLVCALRWRTRGHVAAALALLDDRAVISMALAVAAAVGLAEPAVMILSLALIILPSPAAGEVRLTRI